MGLNITNFNVKINTFTMEIKVYIIFPAKEKRIINLDLKFLFQTNNSKLA